MAFVLARVSQRPYGLAAKVLQQLFVLGSELRIPPSLVRHDQYPDRDALLDER